MIYVCSKILSIHSIIGEDYVYINASDVLSSLVTLAFKRKSALLSSNVVFTRMQIQLIYEMHVNVRRLKTCHNVRQKLFALRYSRLLPETSSRDIVNCRATMYRQRRKHSTCFVKSTALQWWHGSFTTSTNLRTVTACHTLLMGGIFKSCPRYSISSIQFLFLLIIAIYRLPLVFAPLCK